MRVILCVPNFRWVSGNDQPTLWHYIPYNLCMLAAMVRDICDVEIIDANQMNLSPEDFQMMIVDKQPDVVGITVLMDEYGPTGHLCAKLVKEACTADVVMGGVYATTNADEVIRDENIDYVVVGEGEYLFRKLLIGKRIPRGIVPREGFITDIDALPLPAYDLIDLKKYIYSYERKSVDATRLFPYARMFTSRGCPFNCVFCQVKEIAGQGFRARSAENVLNEMQWLRDTYGIKSVIFDDDNMLADRDRAMSIFKGMINRGMKMPWMMITTAVFALDEELLRLIKASGCEYLDVAIESGTERVLKQVINKPLNFEHAKKMIAYARSLGIYVAANFIIGFPTETWEEIRLTLKMAEDIGADYIKLNGAIPLPNTRLWDLCVKEKAFKKGFETNKIKWSTGQIETDHFTADELTLLRAFEWDRINFATPEKVKRTADRMGITIDEMNKIRKDTLLNAVKIVREGK